MNSESNRAAERSSFLAGAGWGDAAMVPLAADASSRRYFRMQNGDRRALLMDAPVVAESAPCPPGATPGERHALGYNAMARLAGPRLDAFVSIARWLREIGVAAPDVFADDPVSGLALIEDFGDDLLVDAIGQGGDEPALYREALDVLRGIRRHSVATNGPSPWVVQSYDDVALQCEADLFIQWYGDHVGASFSEDAEAQWKAVWAELWRRLSPPDTLVLRDYHAENIIVRPGASLAVIDFQDALIGHAAYDVVSLLEDARRDVDLGLAQELYTEDKASVSDPVSYGVDYAILAVQRNAKILGVFARLIHRDGKEKYRQFFPRVAAHFARDLDREEVAPLRAFFEEHMPACLSDAPRAV